MNLKNLNIGTRLSLAFALVLAFAVLLASVGVTRLQKVAEAQAAMDEALHKLDLSEKWYALNIANDGLTEARLRAADPQDDAEIASRMKARSALVTKIQEELQPLIRTDEGKRLYAVTGERRKAYLDIRTRIFEMKNAPDKDAAAIKAMTAEKMAPAMVAYDDAVNDITAWQKHILEDTRTHLQETIASGKLFLMLCTGAVLALGALLAWLLTRSITVPLGKAVAVARSVADGDLTLAVEASGSDETGQLMAALRDMTANLNGIVERVQASSDTIASASMEIAGGNLDLSARTEQQAGSIEETAASIEELSTTVKQNAENARQGNQVAGSASEVASQGGAVVAQVVGTMGEINQSARRIVDIISVIDGIAFQTNILALNAAVEAARAGEQGRGFAVVASEVRTLAQRSAAAAKEIKALIDDSVDKVEIGNRLVNQAGATMEQVVQSVQRVTAIMSEIALASHEQSEGIQQVNEAIRQMDAVTQQNAALVEEAAAATASMQDQAQELAAAVGAFKRARRAAGPAAPALADGRTERLKLAA